jgi:uncharacterized membrane protein YeaQ/YmgE (transglycosylase-associated protein family)
MNEILWIVVAGAAGGLAGLSSRQKGYGKVLSMGGTICFDIGFGFIGAFCLRALFGSLVGAGNLVNHYGMALIGAVVSVAICRLASERYFRSPSYRGMSRSTFIEWHDKLTVKELASWKSRRAEQARSKSPSV